MLIKKISSNSQFNALQIFTAFAGLGFLSPFKIKDDSMSPILNDEDIIITHRQEDVENVNIAMILIDDKDIIIRKVSKKQNSIKLESFNPYYPEQEFTQKDIKAKTIKIIGKVVEARIKDIFK